jgi:AraC-like DNA-binding protein
MTLRTKGLTVDDMRREMGTSTIAAGYAKALLDFAVSRGADRKLLISRSGVDPAESAAQDDRVPLANYVALMTAGIELCNEPALALQFGEAVLMPDVSIVGLICSAAETVGAARLQMNRYARLIVDEDAGQTADIYDIVRDEAGVWLEVNSKSVIGNLHLTEASFSQCVTGARTVLGSTPGFADRNFPRAVHFSHSAPSYRAEYDRIFKAPLVFGSNRNALQIDEEFLSIKLPPSNRYVFGLLNERAEALLKELENSTSIRARVESLLISILHTGETSMDLIAAKQGLSRQTLLRKLKAENTTYEKVLDELRHRMAIEYLNSRKVSINETAYLVGFSEPAAFSRAFKRWTGTSPSVVHRSANGRHN